MPFSHLRDRSLNDRYFRHVANYTYDWESWHDPMGKLVWVNDAVERHTGYTADQCLQMPDYPLPIVAPEDRQTMAAMLAEAIAGRSHNDRELQIVTRQDQRRWMAVSWQPIYGDEGVHLGFRTSARDITERQRLRKQLKLYSEHLEQLVQERTTQIAQLEKHRRQMEKMAALGELAAGVAHEINNPLAGIRNAFTLIREGLPHDHEQQELLGLVDAEIERVASIIHQMYQLYRRDPQPASQVRIAKVIADVKTLLQPIAKRHRVNLDVERAQRPLEATLPEGELKQVLFNVIRNAIQASRPGQSVRVRTYASHACVGVTVRDWGTGISAEDRPHIFEPFFTTKGRLKDGMGLGLSVSRNLVEAMGGEIRLASLPGRGTVFAIRLPREAAAPDTVPRLG
jgi:PAS domain S-box-containing protein